MHHTYIFITKYRETQTVISQNIFSGKSILKYSNATENVGGGAPG